MSVNQCTSQLLAIEKKEQCGILSLARIGHQTQVIKLPFSAIKPLHSFVIPSDTHFLENDVLPIYQIHNNKEQTKIEEFLKCATLHFT